MTPTQAEALLENLFPDYVLADKGYDSDNFVLLLKKRNSEVVIPSKVNRKIQRAIDLDLYKERHLIECCIGKLKHFRRVFSRFDKLAKLFEFRSVCQHNCLAQIIMSTEPREDIILSSDVKIYFSSLLIIRRRARLYL